MRYWTVEEVQLAKHLRDKGWTDSRIGGHLNRTTAAVAMKLTARYGIRGEAEQLARRSILCSPDQLVKRSIDYEALAARDARALRSGCLTSILLGDPPPGRSALDEKGRGV